MHFDFENNLIQDLIEAQVELSPSATAVVFGDQRYTYQEINSQANQLARYLQKLGVHPEVLVGICVDRSPMMVIAMLAVIKAGGAYVPIDPTYPTERINLMLEDSNVSVVLALQQYAYSLPISNATIVCLDSDWSVIENEQTTNPDISITGNNLAYVIYTSGSTGKPKGVMIEHHSLSNFVQSISRKYEITSTDQVLQFASISFDVAVEEIFVTLIKGATLVLRSEEMLRSVQAFLNSCRDWELSVLNLPTAFWHKLCAELPQYQIPDCVRLVVIGSERAIPRWLDVWKRHVADHVRLINAYGPTEATVGSTLCDLAGPHAVDTDQSRVLPIGKPIDNVQAYVLNSELQPVGIGVTGELYIAGEGLARGYLNRPDLTFIRFISASCGDQGHTRLYKTGDLVRYREDGHLEFLGRIDHQEKIRGFRVELTEIEAILEQHLNVKQALVIAREDSPGDKRLVAYIVPTSTLSPNTFYQSSHRLVPNLRNYLRDKLPGYMVPAAFVLLKELPLTPNGKVDRRVLPAPTLERPALDEMFVAPRTALEQDLAQLWSEVLSIAEIGINDNFFEMGGDSLKLIQLISSIEKRHKITVSLLDFSRIPTVAGLAIIIQQSRIQQHISSGYMSLQQLRKEVVLEESIKLHSTLSTFRTEPQSIFLTGSTGFIGAFLLYELLQQTKAKVYCLVRASHLPEAHQKIQTAIEGYMQDANVDYSRIIPVIGDLSQFQLGLTSEQFQLLANLIDTIYHSGANVNMLYPYDALRKTNVFGTHEILRLASSTKPKRLHYLSTLDVFESVAKMGVQIFHENDSIDRGPGISGGYAQSKWVAEQMVREAGDKGLPVTIYRPGMVTGHSHTGHSNTADMLCRFVKSLTQICKAPDLDLMLDMTPIDYVSNTIAKLSLQSKVAGNIFHLVNPQPLPLSLLVEALQGRGYAIQQISYLQWQAAIKLEPNALSPMASLLSDDDENVQRNCLELWLGGNDKFDCTNTSYALTENPLTCPPGNIELINTYLDYFTESGFIETGSACRISQIPLSNL
jgi:amino acid adenylation domain-containing protein/thioester reductase-like protein